MNSVGSVLTKKENCLSVRRTVQNSPGAQTMGIAGCPLRLNWSEREATHFNLVPKVKKRPNIPPYITQGPLTPVLPVLNEMELFLHNHANSHTHSGVPLDVEGSLRNTTTNNLMPTLLSYFSVYIAHV